ncbi:hypothetical protein [uncultured Vagococcus sp.]|uniref:hypothetical protein n=1 Tax=uncultured Vagococcus sp. TaxID=189676 RepID=UPI0028D7C9ED|nr:hypothetical protein [uncultured Vagococcus sp.]
MKHLFALIRVVTYIVLIANQIMGVTKGPLVVLLAVSAVLFLCYDAYETLSTYRHNRQKENNQDS